MPYNQEEFNFNGSRYSELDAERVHCPRWEILIPCWHTCEHCDLKDKEVENEIVGALRNKACNYGKKDNK